MDIIVRLYNSFMGLSGSDKILLLTLIAIIWYSLETRSLRKWQKKQVQLSLLNLHLDRQIAEEEHHNRRFFPFSGDYVKSLRGIMELGKFDVKTLFSPAYHYPLTLRDKVISLFKRIWKKKN